MKKNASGSALVFSLVVLSMILVAALGVASVSVVEKKNSSATGKSTQAFQVADSAVEVVLRHAVLDPTGTTLQELAGELGGSCDINSGVISGTISGGTVEITLSDDGTPPANLGCNDNLSQATTVKSVGRSGDTTRAINSAVAAGTLVWNNLTTKNGWSNGFTPTYSTVGYVKDSRTGIVYLRGLLWHDNNTSVSTEAMFDLPADIKPAKAHTFFVPGANGNPSSIEGCRIQVSTSTVAPIGQAAAWCSLDGIFYTTES